VVLGQDVVFHKTSGGSGEIRGTQMARHLHTTCNPSSAYPDATHIYVKMQPPNDFPERSYLDVLDGHQRIPWLLKHPRMGVIASSQTGFEELCRRLRRTDVVLIPQHHCNFERVKRMEGEIEVAGVVGGRGAIQCDVEELKAVLADIGIEWRWQQYPRTRDEVFNFYAGIDVQVVWRKMNRPLKNPLKIVNAMSFGIPTVAYPELAYREVEGYYWPATTMEELVTAIGQLRQGFDAERLIDKAEEYHIENIALLYRDL
jgi:hypothetical protein